MSLGARTAPLVKTFGIFQYNKVNMLQHVFAKFVAISVDFLNVSERSLNLSDSPFKLPKNASNSRDVLNSIHISYRLYGE